MILNGPVLTALLVVVFVAAGTVLIVLDETAPGIFMLCVATFGLLVVMGMAFADARDRGALPPPKVK